MAVIGAGPSGLVAVKELLEEGHEPICFERAPPGTATGATPCDAEYQSVQAMP